MSHFYDCFRLFEYFFRHFWFFFSFFMINCCLGAKLYIYILTKRKSKYNYNLKKKRFKNFGNRVETPWGFWACGRLMVDLGLCVSSSTSPDLTIETEWRIWWIIPMWASIKSWTHNLITAKSFPVPSVPVGRYNNNALEAIYLFLRKPIYWNISGV